MFRVAHPSERPALLDVGRRVWIGERSVTISQRGGTTARPLLKLEGVDGRAEAEALGGLAITVPRDELGPLVEGEHLVDDLISCEVRGAGRSIGRVRDVLLLPSVDVLEVERPGGDTLLVPLVNDAVTEIDVERGRIDLNPDFLQLDGESA
jgi:16S rRNA processing protein RimM